MILSILVFILVLSLLVFIHELGHFLVAKKIGIRVEEFGFGLPPRIWGFKKGETLYSLNWLPIGGFVKLSGEDEVDIKTKNPQELKRYFFARTKKERAAVLLAGITMNFLLAVVIISYMFTKGVSLPNGVLVEELLPDSPAIEAGLQADDTIIEYDGTKVYETQDLVRLTRETGGEQVNVVLLRGPEKTQVTISVTPRKDPPENQGPLGVRISTSVDEVKYPWYIAPYHGLIWAFKFSYLIFMTLLDTLYKLVTFQQARIDVGGPVAIYKATDEAVKFGTQAVLNLMGLLSLNLAIFNLLPIPALDGGRLMFVVFEKFLGRKVKPAAELVAHQIGMAFLIGLIILVTINDIVKSLRG